MRVALAVLVLPLVLGTGAHAARAPGGGTPELPGSQPRIVPGELIVRFADGVPQAEQEQALARAGARSKRKLGKATLRLAGASPDRLRKVLAALEDDPRVEYAEPNFVVTADVLPNDPSFGQLWGLHNTGQTVNGVRGTADADIDAPEAWDVTRGSVSTVVGVVDTGIDFGHPDLAAGRWTNPGESCTGCRTDGVDNDGNGFVDDWRGWDFVDDDNDPTDDHGHGTHVAGTIGATADNGIGVAGVGRVSLLALKFLDDLGSGTTADAVRAINYATAAGAHVTNNSWGGGGFSQALYDAVAEADARGSLFVAAAGNDGTNNDTRAHYPSNYDLPNVISVAATDSRDALADFSNYGARTVHLAAPGVEVYSTVPGGYDHYSGTSMATPHVAGALALAKSAHPTAGGLALKALVLRTADANASSQGKTATGGRLNVNGAVRCSGAPRLWLDAPGQGFTVAVGQPLKINALVGCGTATTTATVNGQPVTLTARGDGLWSGTYLPTAAGTLTVTATAGSESRTVSGSAVDDYWQTAVPFAWVDATAGGTRLSLGDDSAATVALPFTFQFYKQPFTSVKVSSNGYVVFGSSAATDYWNEAIPNTVAPNGFAAPLWDDLNPIAGGGVWHRTVGTAPNRRFVVSWNDVPHYGMSDGATFQVVLEEGTNAILYQYRDTTMGDSTLYDYGASATVGVENAAGTAGKQFLYAEPLLQEYENATAIRFAIGAPADSVPPAAPSGLVATAGELRVALDWADSAESDLAGYRVYRRATDGSWTRIAQTASSAHTDSGLTAGTAYAYRVTAYDQAGNESAASAQASATPTADVTAPAAPAGLAATAGDRSVALGWTGNSESDLAGYRVYRASGTTWELIASVTTNAHTDTGLVNGTAYSYRVTAVDVSGNESPASATATATPRDLTAPGTPTSLSATGGDGRVVLDWGDNTESDLAGYRVYRAEGTTWTLLASVTGSVYTDSGLANGTTYSYRVTAYDSAGNESAPAAASATPRDAVAPAAPGGLTAAGAQGSVALDWADNGESDLAGYRVYRRNADGAWSHVATVAASAHTDTTVNGGTTYTYRITALDTSGNESAPSATASATPTNPPISTYRPAGYSILQGALAGGSLASLDADDGSRLEISKVGGVHVAAFYAYATVPAAEVATLRTLTIAYDGHASHGQVAITLSVYNWRTGSWQVVDGPRTGVTADRFFSWSATAAARDYVSSAGEVRFQVRGQRDGGLNTRTDLIRFTVEY